MSQTESILKHLETGKTITQLQAYSLCNCTRLAARIADIKAMGKTVTTRAIKKNGKTFAEYKLGA